jgi:dihydroorotate dehydrogenase electron transfer subunit
LSALPQEDAARHAGVHPAHRGSIFLEDGKLLAQESWPGEQFVLRISAPQCAARALLVGGGVGIPPMIFLAEWMLEQPGRPWSPLVLMGSEIPFPFKTRPSTILVSGIPAGAIAAHPLLDGWSVPSRLASKAGFPGCHDGFVTQLADEWLGGLDAGAKAEVEVFSCGPTPMLEAMAKVAAQHDVPCQVSLEEFMACAVGGCAGCTVKVATPDGAAMKRVCVDGPVFDARAVFGR